MQWAGCSEAPLSNRECLQSICLSLGRKRLDNLLVWLKKEQPDVVSLQELKIEPKAFPVDVLRSLGYEAVWQGERSWNGVAILARNQTPVLTRSSLPGDSRDRQARYIEAAVQGILITSIYLPNGNPLPGPKFTYKLSWFERLLTTRLDSLRRVSPWSWRVTTTWCPRLKTSIPPDLWIRMP